MNHRVCGRIHEVDVAAQVDSMQKHSLFMFFIGRLCAEGY